MNTNLDSVDLKILAILQRQSRLSNKQIGDIVYKSASSVSERIHRLEQTGVITGYGAFLDNKKIDRGQLAFTHVQLKDHSKETLGHFESEVVKFPEVLECYHTSGQYDFILRVAVRDLIAYHEFLMEKLFAIMSVGSVQSTFVMKEAKREIGYPLPLSQKK